MQEHEDLGESEECCSDVSKLRVISELMTQKHEIATL
jgi:hypothetical protein